MKPLAIAVCCLLLCSRLSAADLSASEAYQQGLVLFTHGDYTQARTTFEKLEPTLQRRADFNFHYAITLLQTARSADALKFMRRAIDLAPGNAEYRYALGLIYSARVSELSLFRAAMLMDDAKQTSLKALELDPTHVGATLALAEFYLDVPGVLGGGKDRALPLLDRLWKLDPAAAAELNTDITYAHLWLAIAYRLQGDPRASMPRSSQAAGCRNACAKRPKSAARKLASVCSAPSS